MLLIQEASTDAAAIGSVSAKLTQVRCVVGSCACVNDTVFVCDAYPHTRTV